MKLQRNVDGNYVNLDSPEAKADRENKDRREELMRQIDKIPVITHNPTLSGTSISALIGTIQNSQGKLYCVKFLREISRLTAGLSLLETKQFIEQFAESENIEFPEFRS